MRIKPHRIRMVISRRDIDALDQTFTIALLAIGFTYDNAREYAEFLRSRQAIPIDEITPGNIRAIRGDLTRAMQILEILIKTKPHGKGRNAQDNRKR